MPDRRARNRTCSPSRRIEASTQRRDHWAAPASPRRERRRRMPEAPYGRRGSRDTRASARGGGRWSRWSSAQVSAARRKKLDRPESTWRPWQRRLQLTLLDEPGGGTSGAAAALRSQGTRVELPGSSYLYTLSMVSITFVGFSALLVVMRQAKGGGLTNYDTYFTLSFIQIGFLVTASGLVPPVFASFDWSATVVWHVSSTVVALPILWFVARVPARRRAATGMPVPVFVAALLSVQATAAAVLLLNATGAFS